MKLAICTDVFADLSYTDMLDKVKSLGIDAVEMTAGGWGARKHCNTAELLADEGKRKEFMGELEKRGMRISALNTSCNPLWPSKTGEEYKKSMYDCATLAGLLGVKKIVAMAGLPAGNETDTTPNWITSTVSWPDFMAPAYEYQWKVTIEFWNEFIAHCKKCGIDPASLKGKVLCLNTGMHRLFDDSKAYYHYSIGTGIDAGKWFVKHGVKCVAMDSQALDHPLHTAMGNNGMTRMNLLGATGKPITEEYKELFGEEAYAEFDKFEYIRIHGQAAYDEKFGELEDLGVWGTWEPCHKEMLGHGIVGVENLGGDLDKIKPGKVFNFFCFPLRWYMGDGAMSRCVAFIDEDDVDASVPDRTYKYGGTGYADESGHGDSGLEYMRKLFNRNK